MTEITASQIVLFFGACLFTIVVFLLKDLYASFKQLHDRVNEIEKKGYDPRIKKMEERAVHKDNESERFWKDIPKLFNDSIAPHLMLITRLLDDIDKRMNKIEAKQ